MSRARELDRKRRSANIQLIEQEIKCYPEMKRQLEELRMAIIESTSVSEVPVETGPGDETLSKVIRLRSSPVMLEIERRIRAVEYALEVFRQSPDPQRIRMIEMHYFEGRLRPYGIQMELSISRSTFYRWRREFIELVAEKLGWEV